MKLVVGLGNPGSQYNFTRHNSGFLALDFYFKRKNLKWESSPKFGAEWLKVRAADLNAAEDVIFIKPQDFYNESGRAVHAFQQYYKIALDDIIAVCDDFNLDFGKLRFRENGSAGGNNGLKSMIAELHSDAFPRLRIGTGNGALRAQLGDTDFVLGKFTLAEREQLPTILSAVEARLDDILS
ncbi:MAG: aminoacyl-tRNA hydrolase [Candidatus Saccharibacteria bacterium]|nr:aminoacyl-tRNA hydrolase [Candidatus Saccharibacteria bacterium]